MTKKVIDKFIVEYMEYLLTPRYPYNPKGRITQASLASEACVILPFGLYGYRGVRRYSIYSTINLSITFFVISLSPTLFTALIFA